MDSYQSKAVAKEGLAKRRKRGNPTENVPAGRPAASDDLSGRIYKEGNIQPGAHPEFEKPTPGERFGAWFKKTFRPRAKTSASKG